MTGFGGIHKSLKTEVKKQVQKKSRALLNAMILHRLIYLI